MENKSKSRLIRLIISLVVLGALIGIGYAADLFSFNFDSINRCTW